MTRWNIPGVVYPPEHFKRTQARYVDVPAILELDAAGLSQPEISARLGIHQTTVSVHLIRNGRRRNRVHKRTRKAKL